MCGISGAIIKERSNLYWDLLRASEIRGQDGTGIAAIMPHNISFTVQRSEKKASESDIRFLLYKDDLIIGQNRLAIFGLDHKNDQPLVTERYALVHNGNLVDFEETFKIHAFKREYEVDSELILRFIEELDAKNPQDYYDIIARMSKMIKGNWACLLLDKRLGCIVAFTRYKPLFFYDHLFGTFFFSTERIGEKVFGKQNFTPVDYCKVFTSGSG